MTKLNIQSIFHSIDGEANGYYGAGQLATFIRLKGCNLNCQYCDTLYSQNTRPENWMDMDDIIKQIRFPKITITGGEPLLQKEEVENFCSKLLILGFYQNNFSQISIETNGTIAPEYFWNKIRYIVDWKLPSSNMEDKMNLLAFKHLRPLDIIKFVISDWNDYNRALEVITQNSDWRAQYVFSPALTLLPDTKTPTGVTSNYPPRYNMTWPRSLVEKMIEDEVPAQFSLQLHKMIWPGTKVER